MNEKQKEFLAQSGINLTDGLAYFSENERLYEKYLFRFLGKLCKMLDSSQWPLET